MVILHFQGRLANNIYQFIAAYYFSLKHNLPLFINTQSWVVDYRDSIYNIMVSKHTISQIFENETIFINNDNFIEYYNNNNIDINKKYEFIGHYQIKEFIEPLISDIKKLFLIEYDEKINNNDVFLHYRLGDIQDTQFKLPLEYYIEALSLIDYSSGYISSDSIEHENCQFLIREFNLKPINLSPWDTILFGKNFKNIILSEGSFSSIIGVFSNANKIISNDRELKWGGNICNGLDSYIKLSWGYNHESKPKNFKNIN